IAIARRRRPTLAATAPLAAFDQIGGPYDGARRAHGTELARDRRAIARSRDRQLAQARSFAFGPAGGAAVDLVADQRADRSAERAADRCPDRPENESCHGIVLCKPPLPNDRPGQGEGRAHHATQAGVGVNETAARRGNPEVKLRRARL